MNNKQRCSLKEFIRDYTEYQLLFSLNLAQLNLESSDPDSYYYWEEMVTILEFELESRNYISQRSKSRYSSSQLSEVHPVKKAGGRGQRAEGSELGTGSGKT